VHDDGQPGLLGERPEPVVVVVGGRGAVGVGGQDRTPVAQPDRPLQLGDGVVDPGRRNDRLPDQPVLRSGAELGQPVVVGADAGELELAVGPVQRRPLQRHRRVEDLRPDAVGVHVGEACLLLDAPGTDLAVAQAVVAELRDVEPRDRVQPERARPLPVLKAPDVAVVSLEQLGRPLPQRRRHPALPQLRGFVDMPIGVDQQVVEVGEVGERRLHRRPAIPPAPGLRATISA
jgi:hypothetical protein